MLHQTTTTDAKTDAPPPSSSFKQGDYFHDRNDGELLLAVTDPLAPTMAPSIQRFGRRPLRRAITSSSSSSFSLPSPPLHTHSNKLQTSLSKSSPPIATLPSEILISILIHLRVEQLLPLQLVSRKFRHLARTVLLDKFACTTPNKSRSSNAHVSATMTSTVTTTTPNIPKPATTADAGDPRAISLHLFPDSHHTPKRWHECQTVVLHCTTIDRLQEVLLFQPVDPSNNTLTLAQQPSFTRSQYQQPRGTGMASRNMEVEAELMRRAVRFSSPTIGLNFFDYSTGQRSRLAPSLLSSTTPLNPYIRSLGYNTDTNPLSRFDPATRLPTSPNDTSMDYKHHVIGIKHGGWPNLSDQDSGGGWCHWSTNGGSDCLGGSSQREIDSDDKVMLCLQSDDTRGLEVGGSKLAMIWKSETEMDRAVNDDQSTKVHRHRLFQPLHGHGRTPSRFTKYCCLHLHHYHRQHQDDKGGQGAINVNGEEESGTTRAGNKDWWIEYRLVPIEAPACQSCSQQDRHRRHGGSGGGARVEFRELRVSLDWILSGFMNKV